MQIINICICLKMGESSIATLVVPSNYTHNVRPFKFNYIIVISINLIPLSVQKCIFRLQRFQVGYSFPLWNIWAPLHYSTPPSLRITHCISAICTRNNLFRHPRTTCIPSSAIMGSEYHPYLPPRFCDPLSTCGMLLEHFINRLHDALCRSIKVLCVQPTVGWDMEM